MTEYETLRVSTRDGILEVRLDRPDALNAINFQMAEELLELFAVASRDEGTRAVLLTGEGRGFCAGADLVDLAGAAAEYGDLGPARFRDIMRATSMRLAAALIEFDKPLVAAVNGPCAGAGMGLALAADVLVASEHASFSVVFVRRGLVPDYGVSFLLPRLVGLRRARELCLLGDRVTAEEAGAMGLATVVCPAAELGTVAGDYAQRLAQGPGIAQRLTKRMMADAFETSSEAALDREFTYQALAMVSDDAREGMTAFLEKREPRFRGR